MTKGILVVSFGTSYKETRQKTIEACEKRIQDAYPSMRVYRAFTSEMVIRSIEKKEGIRILNVSKALEQMYHDGITEVYIQSLHIINGGEFEKIISQAKPFEERFKVLKIGEPLLNSIEDYDAVKSFLIKTYSFDHAETILMGHGSEHHAFTTYAAMDHMLAKTSVHIAAVESYPSLEMAEQHLQKCRVKKVHLAPFMLVAGDHAINDMASSDEDSWYTFLTDRGYQVTTHLIGLGEYPAIQDIYVKHLAEIM